MKDIIEECIYNLCKEANINLASFEKIKNAYDEDKNEKISLILKNAYLSQKKQMPLCQDTGQVIIFAKGRNFPKNFKTSINNGVEKAYKECFFRKSIVKNSVFNRQNTHSNTPCIIYTEIKDIENIEISVLIKGGGSENVSTIEPLSPTATHEDIENFVVNAIKNAGTRACPPYFVGVGVGGTLEYAGILSKKALILNKNINSQHQKMADNIKNAANKLIIPNFDLKSLVLDVKILSDFTHIACMPVAVTINCHSLRHATATIMENGEIIYKKNPEISKFEAIKDYEKKDDGIKISTNEIEKLKSLKEGQKILLSGEIYTARDMAHKKIVELISNKKDLPFDIKNKIIFYAGPCPSKIKNKVGSIGPTTAKRMDKFAPILYKNGVIGTIAKGERSNEITRFIKENNVLYFTTLGGIACYLSEKVTNSEIVAFEELGPEAVYRLEIKDFPLWVCSA